MELYYGNVTFLGPKAQAYLFAMRTELLAVAEHRLLQERIRGVASAAKLQAWRTHVDPA